MSEKLPPQPWMTAPGARRILDALTRDGARVRFVGGCVRNALIDAAVGDLDVATPDDPEIVTDLLSAAGLKAIPTGYEHGTVTAVTGDTVIEVTTLRRDVETDGRHASVEFTTDWAADARRRDFTMNAIYADLDGTLFDPVGGVEDLKAGRLRFIGDARTRIGEDYLRILRFFRFHAWYGQGPLDADGLAAVAAMAGGLSQLSAERVQKEIMRLLGAPASAPHLSATINAMSTSGVLTHVLPEAVHVDRFRHLVILEDAVLQGAVDALLRLAALTLPTESGPTAIACADAVADRLRLSNRARGRLIGLAEADLKGELSQKAARRALYRLGAETFADRLLLEAAETDAPETDKLDHLLDVSSRWVPPSLPVTGQDVVDAGVPPGPEIGRLLGALEAIWIEQDFRTRRAELLRRLAALLQEG